MGSSRSNPPTVPPSPPPSTIIFLPRPQDNSINNINNIINNNNNDYNLNNRIMLIAILCLSFVIVLVVILHLYARYVMRRHLANRRANYIRTFRMGLASSSAIEMPETHNAGLSSSVIGELPLFGYNRSDYDNASLECSVCLSVLEEGEMVRMLPACKHMFHVQCIDMWLHSHCTCPVCRAGVEAVVERGETSSGTTVLGLSSSFRRMLTRERSGRRVHDVSVVGDDDLERH